MKPFANHLRTTLINNPIFSSFSNVKHMDNIPIHNETRMCFWGIHKSYSTKSCYRAFIKMFGQLKQVTHICKPNNKQFFIIKFNEPINLQNFTQSSKKKLKYKQLTVQEMNLSMGQSPFISIQQLKNPQFETQSQAKNIQVNQSQSQAIEMLITPLHKMPYQEQVQYKVKEIKEVLRIFMKGYKKNKIVKAKNIVPNRLLLSEFIQYPKNCNFYRTKCEFTFGLDSNAQMAIGFVKGNFVDLPTNSSIVHPIMTNIVKQVQTYYQKLILIDGYEQFKCVQRHNGQGFWKEISVQFSQRTNEAMVTLMCKSKQFCQLKVNRIKQDITKLLTSSFNQIISISWQESTRVQGEPESTPQLLWGSSFYHEIVLSQNFKVQSGAFLQTNIRMAELLYQEVIQLSKNYDVIIDVGCGIGIIGTLIMKDDPKVKVIGIDINKQSIKAAQLNNKNYDARLGSAEQIMKSICEEIKGKKVLAILDPPRAGFGKSVMKALRRSHSIQSIIYIACNANAIYNNLQYLTLPCSSKRPQKEFQIEQVKGFDMFPMTKHYELMYYLKRVKEIVE